MSVVKQYRSYTIKAERVRRWTVGIYDRDNNQKVREVWVDAVMHLNSEDASASAKYEIDKIIDGDMTLRKRLTRLVLGRRKFNEVRRILQNTIGHAAWMNGLTDGEWSKIWADIMPMVLKQAARRGSRPIWPTSRCVPERPKPHTIRIKKQEK